MAPHMGQGQRETLKRYDSKNSHFSWESSMAGTHLQYLYMNTHTMGYKQGQWDIHGQLQSFDLAGLTEQQWDALQDKDL